MRKFLVALCLIGGPGCAAASGHDGALSYTLELLLTESELDGLTLDDDPDRERLVKNEYELAFSIEYQASDRLFYYFGGSLIDETETVKPRGERETVSGFERGEIGVGYSLGREVESEIRLGRREFLSTSDWWYWWDEELDAISLESRFGRFEALLALAEEQAREVSGMDRIDPEFDDVRRFLASFDWQIADGQLLQVYYLDQQDRSSSYRDEQSIEEEKIDEEDADLTWSGLNYFGWFDSERLGEFEIELALAHVSGRETVYAFNDPAGGLVEVDETVSQRVSGDAHGMRVKWRPAVFDEITFVVGHAHGSGDGLEDDGRNDAFRQTGLQGDSEVFGELYQPELSNLVVDTFGIEFRLLDEFDLGVFRYDFSQDEAAGEMRAVAIDADTSGTGRELGSEIDLVLMFDVRDLEIEIIAAEFEAGSAYGPFDGETSRFWQVELTYVF